ncbi:MAG TPA: metal ABC transporter ATP-binding protein [Candidatus Dojkabacteria bacterium]|jgi:ABC-type Mn2+/Zn2+ transport system ATPase subunit
MNKALEIQNLNVKLGNAPILKNISFSIDKGELAYLFGRNGSGKSTLVKAILGLIPYHTGTIKLDGNHISQKQVADKIGYVPQYSDIERDFPISVKEIIELECGLGRRCPVIPEEHLRILNAENLVNKKLSNLSGGEFQKVLIARTLILNPEIIIMDEPFNNLDDNSQKFLVKFIADMNKAGKTIILISHDYNIIEHNAKTRILYLEEGKLIEETEESLVHKDFHLSKHHAHGS